MRPRLFPNPPDPITKLTRINGLDGCYRTYISGRHIRDRDVRVRVFACNVRQPLAMFSDCPPISISRTAAARILRDARKAR